MTASNTGLPRGALRLGAIASLDAIVLRSVDWKAYNAPAPSEQIVLETEYNLAHGKSGPTVRYQLHSRITGKVGTTEAFRSELVHEAYLSLPADDATATDEELEEFGRITVFFMVFPYVREFVHLLTGGSGLPAQLLAPVRLPIDPALSIPQQAELATPGSTSPDVQHGQESPQAG
jgi:preprotein translocase subunit SecB